MKRRNRSALVIFLLVLSINISPLPFDNTRLLQPGGSVAQAQAGLPAFPGAEGYGAVATGGRGGQVIHITNLNATGPGSLQAAVSTPGARIVVFDVSGVINGDITITEPNITIAGQTAPGAGITIAGQFFTEYAYGIDNIIVRFVRVRPGPLSGAGGDAIQFSRSRRVILDHVSVAWGIDETIDIYEGQDVTIQYCAIEESGTTGHPEGPHNYGLINGPDGARVSVHHNLFAHHRKRCPALANGPSDTRNNVVYNAHIGFIHDNPSTGVHNIVGNYYKAGPNRDIIEPFYMVDDNNAQGQAYWADNFIDDNSPFIYEAVNDPIAEWSKYPGLNGTGMRVTTPAATPPVTTHTSAATYNAVLDRAGTFPRDVVANRIVQETRDRTGSWGIHRPSDLMQGLTPGTRPTDTDNDGMPNAWETARGLNPNNGDDHSTVMPSGYTAIEEYINELADSLIPASGCTTSTAPTSASYGTSGGSGSVSVTAPAGCSWAATSNASWITITSGSSGSGPGTVNYTVAANSGASRTGTMTIASRTFTVSQAAGAGCKTATAGGGYVNTAFTNQTGTFTVQFDATPSAAPIDSPIGLSNGAQGSSANFSGLVRFNPAGNIDARNGTAYAAAAMIPYSANQTYHFRLVVNVPARTYTIYVTPPGGPERVVGTNYAFRATATQLNNWGVTVDAAATGTNRVCNFTIN
jgi:pectate lyase